MCIPCHGLWNINGAGGKVLRGHIGVLPKARFPNRSTWTKWDLTGIAPNHVEVFGVYSVYIEVCCLCTIV